MTAAQTKYIQTAVALLSCVAIGVGFAKLYVYANTPGVQADARPLWPAASRLLTPLKSGRPALVIFAHPRCPCSRATLDELESMRAEIGEHGSVTVVFVKPSGETDDWAKEELWQKASALPNVRVVLDEGGREAEAFGAKTSGQALLYNGEGKLIFKGGLTPQRGHVGDSAGRTAVLAFFAKGLLPEAQAKTSVFGCSLLDPERAPAVRRPNGRSAH